MDQLDALKTVLLDSLEKRGVLESIRGRMRAEVFHALEDGTAVKPKPSNDTILINELIMEYLEYNNYKYAASTLKAESGQTDLPLTREFIESELQVKTLKQSRKLPLLYMLVHSFKQQGKENKQMDLDNTALQEQHKHIGEHDSVNTSSGEEE